MIIGLTEGNWAELNESEMDVIRSAVALSEERAKEALGRTALNKGTNGGSNPAGEIKTKNTPRFMEDEASE